MVRTVVRIARRNTGRVLTRLCARSGRRNNIVACTRFFLLGFRYILLFNILGSESDQSRSCRHPTCLHNFLDAPYFVFGVRVRCAALVCQSKRGVLSSTKEH
mmetsp:Transcript_20952/g.31767  ORF Transcript_20952/g.31767 Transcript_20952/m.31767 type:complete len:102 (-) Transcript_20952:417-722(-)